MIQSVRGDGETSEPRDGNLPRGAHALAVRGRTRAYANRNETGTCAIRPPVRACITRCCGPVALVICFRQTHARARKAELVHVKRYNFYRDHLILFLLFFFFFFHILSEPVRGIVEIPVRTERPSYGRAHNAYATANCSFGTAVRGRAETTRGRVGNRARARPRVRPLPRPLVRAHQQHAARSSHSRRTIFASRRAQRFFSVIRCRALLVTVMKPFGVRVCHR
uniref:Uncharacterized protein n=1 Tax=Sipha flava TaxID=143950 RepID=A0A2S2QBM5_9HEMI